jgi:exonuclease III
MLAYIKKLEQQKPVVWCGDLNVKLKNKKIKKYNK